MQGLGSETGMQAGSFESKLAHQSIQEEEVVAAWWWGKQEEGEVSSGQALCISKHLMNCISAGSCEEATELPKEGNFPFFF